MAERAFERVVGELGDLAGHLDAGGAGTDDGEGQQLLAARGIAGPLGLFERAKDAATQLECVIDRLHARRPLGEVIVAEVRLACARGDDQAVVGRDVRVTQQLRLDGLIGQVDVADFAEQHLCVLLVAQDDSRGGCDLARRDDAGCHLVEQRLKQVVGCLGDQLDVDVGSLQGLGGVQPAEP